VRQEKYIRCFYSLSHNTQLTWASGPDETAAHVEKEHRGNNQRIATELNLLNLLCLMS